MKVPGRAFTSAYLIGGGKNPSKLAQGFLVTLIGDLGKVAGKLQAHPLARADCVFVSLIQPIEKVVDRYAQDLSDLKQSASGHAVDTAFVFVCLLIGHPDKISKLLLGQPEHDAALSDACADIPVDVLGPARRSARRGGR